MAHTIEIDFDVHKLIETERRGFDDPPLAALRRLLKLPDTPKEVVSEQPGGRPWTYKNVVLEHGTQLQMQYNHRTHEARIVDGRWLVEGEFYDSPSGAAVAVARTKEGKPTQLNGWDYWDVKSPGSSRWRPINLLLKPEYADAAK